jgi:hypothetical protein
VVERFSKYVKIPVLFLKDTYFINTISRKRIFTKYNDTKILSDPVGHKRRFYCNAISYIHRPRIEFRVQCAAIMSSQLLDGIPDCTYSCKLEIKSNGSRLVSGWAAFRFVLSGQDFVPHSLNSKDNSMPRGCLKIAGCKATKIRSDAAEGKFFPFSLYNSTTAYLFNASNEVLRERIITLLNFASATPNWFDPYNLGSLIELEKDMFLVSKVFFSSPFAKEAAVRMQCLFHVNVAKRKYFRMLSQWPELNLVSVNKAEGITGLPATSSGKIAGKVELFAYVSGLVVTPVNIRSARNIFQETHKVSTPVCISCTPPITKSNSFHVALVSYSSALSYLSVAIADVAEMGKASQTLLGIVSAALFLLCYIAMLRCRFYFCFCFYSVDCKLYCDMFFFLIRTVLTMSMLYHNFRRIFLCRRYHDASLGAIGSTCPARSISSWSPSTPPR